MSTSDHSEPMFRVVVNDEEQYSIWPADGELPPGWCDVQVHGTRSECLAHVERAWKDMRPLSLRRQMEIRSTNGVES